MLAVLSSRQVRNRQLRDLGIEPQASYQTNPQCGDRVFVREVSDVFPEVEHEAVVIAIEEAGCRLDVSCADDDGEIHKVLLNRDGVPPDWGVIEFRIVRRHRRESEHDSRSHYLPAGYGVLPVVVYLDEPETCPECHAMHDARPIEGWPCLACRTREAVTQ